MTEQPLIYANNVGKKFCRDLRRSLIYGLRDIAGEARRSSSGKHPSKLRTDEFWANKHISFQVRRGECLGLIGRNGSGKTTVLKQLVGLIKPDEGYVRMRGKVAAMIALGAGFNPVLTGRENIFVNGSILGLSKKQIKRRLDQIIDFAELEDFIDTPVRNYSSGMNVRLGFAICTAMNPDILILDEVLAVGDAAFRAKCYAAVAKLCENSAVIYVAHDMNQVGRLCDHCVVLKDGKVHAAGDTTKAIKAYNADNEAPDIPTQRVIIFDKEIQTASVHFSTSSIATGDNCSVVLYTNSKYASKSLRVRCNLCDATSRLVADYDSNTSQHQLTLGGSNCQTKIHLGRLPLANGSYTLNVAIYDQTGKKTLVHAPNACTLEISGNLITTAPLVMGTDK